MGLGIYLRIVFIGTVKLSADLLEELLRFRNNVVGICTKSQSTFNSDYQDLAAIASEHKIPCMYTTDINSSGSINWIKNLEPDLIFCIGWSQIIHRELLSVSRIGVIGFHPAELPRNRGRHPIVWSLVLGLKRTASTFFFLDDGVDSGDIVSQREIEIEESDNSQKLYEKISSVAAVQIKEIVLQLETSTLQRIKQNSELSNTWRKRSEYDGLIDWRMSAKSIHNLVRGLSAPYVGAHFINKDQVVKVWESVESLEGDTNMEPGKVIRRTDRGPIIKCGEGSIILLKTEPEFWKPEGDYL